MQIEPSNNHSESPLGDYEVLCDNLKNLPMTWYPALIKVMVEAVYELEVFNDGGASAFIAAVERQIGKDKK